MQEQESTQNQLQTADILINAAPKKKRVVTKKGKAGDNVSSPIISTVNSGNVENILKTINNAATGISTVTIKETSRKEPDSNINTIHHGDCITGMKLLADMSVDIIICDPPYNIGKDFGNNSDKQTMEQYLKWCDEWIAECMRILKPRGTLYIYGFSETLAFIRTRLTCNVRWLIWHYTNKVTPSLNFWQRTHESILCCYKETPIFNRDDVREPYTDSFLKNAAGKVRKATKGRFSNGDKETVYTAHEGGALPRDVIKIPALAGGAGKKERVDHPTQKPLTLCETLIKAALNKDGNTLMVSPFAGSGSECVAAKMLGVNYIGYEINKDYVELACNRLQ
jgi:site-specific DNA-methyltransferase (adenine-specific)